MSPGLGLALGALSPTSSPLPPQSCCLLETRKDKPEARLWLLEAGGVGVKMVEVVKRHRLPEVK